MITHITQSPAPLHTGANAYGYGPAVAIGWKVRTHGAGPWRRLRVASYGNGGGTPEYIEDGASHYVDDDTLAALEIASCEPGAVLEWRARDIARNYASPGSIGATLAQFATTGSADHLELVEDIRATLAQFRNANGGILPWENVDLWHLLAYALTR